MLEYAGQDEQQEHGDPWSKRETPVEVELLNLGSRARNDEANQQVQELNPEQCLGDDPQPAGIVGYEGVAGTHRVDDAEEAVKDDVEEGYRQNSDEGDHLHASQHEY